MPTKPFADKLEGPESQVQGLQGKKIPSKALELSAAVYSSSNACRTFHVHAVLFTLSKEKVDSSKR
eukprot:363116-Chlamydomonas_euryale.AAC.3